jgi:transposase-like protein
MAHQKVFKKKKPWETPELIAARTECIRLHTEMKYPVGDIAKLLNKTRNQIRRWLIAANCFQHITPRQRVERRNRSPEFAHRLIRAEYNRELTALKAIDRLSVLCVCKECGIVFKPKLGFQEFCGQKCRTKSYLKLNREVIAEKSKKKSELKHKSRAEKLYAAKNPKCNFCHDPIPFSRFLVMSNIIYCSQKCNQKAQLEKRKNDPIRAAAYKAIKAKTYLKRQLNGKNRLEKRKYLRNNIQARIAKNLRTRLFLAVKRQGGKKCDLTMSLTGADWPTFSAWIQNKFQKDMTWENYGRWHVDHIIPCKSFDLTKPEQQRECFHYSNLQPLWGLENIKKGSRIIPKQTALIFDRKNN